MPHGHCYFWTPALVWLHAISDALIALSYFTIPIVLLYFVRKRSDLQFSWMFVCFAVFIVACGTTHLLEIWNIWHSAYWLAGGAKAVTALASVPTAFLLAQLVSPALQLVSPKQLEALNATLQDEVDTRTRAEAAVRELNAELERRVAERTAELQQQVVEKEQIESELRESREQLCVALEAGQIGDWDLDLEHGTIKASHLHDRIFGYSETQESWDVSRFIGHLHPDDREEVRLKFERCVSTGTAWNEQFRIVTVDGVVRTVWARGRIIEAAGARTRRMLGVVVDVTDLDRSTQTALQLAAIVDSSADAIIGKNLNSIVTSWNAGAERMFGYSAAEMLDSSIVRLIPLDLQQEEQAILNRLKSGLHIDQFETVRIRKDGSLIDVSLTISPIRNFAGEIIAASAIARDISEQKRGQRALEESEARFRQLADSMPDIVWTSRPDGVLDYYNHRWYEYTGQPEGLAGDESWAPVLHPDDLARCAATWSRAVASGSPYTIEYRFLDHRTQEYRWHLGRALAIRDENGEIVRWYGTGTDIHELKTAQADLEGARTTLEQRVHDRTTQLAAANKELEAFSYSVSHDLRAPLRAVSGFSRIVAEEHAANLDSEGKRYLQTIQTSAMHMGHLLDDLLAFSHVGRESMKIADLNMRNVVESAFATFHADLRDRRVDLAVRDLPRASGDVALLRQVWINLLSNALKYTRSREVTSITVGAQGTGERPVFFIRDNGVGFDMKYAQNVFGVFQRLHLAEDYEGTGVGLALVQRIIHRHGGEIWVEAQENSGATFFFTLGEVRDV